MKTSPIYIFEDETSTGVYSVPESGFILIRKLSTEDEPLIITKVSNTFNGSFDNNTTISDFLLNGDYDGLAPESELEKITEGLNTGWRLLGKDPTLYGDTGEMAIDFSESLSSLAQKGATGEYSFAEGLDTLAKGIASHAEGSGTTATGDYSHASGLRTIASREAMAVFGKYNINSSLNIFEIGLGTDVGVDNGFEVEDCGTTNAPMMSNPMIDIGRAGTNPGRVLVTRDYLDSRMTNRRLNHLIDVVSISNIDTLDVLTANTRYLKGDLIRDGGLVYVCDISYTTPATCTMDLFYWDQVVAPPPQADVNHLLVYRPIGGTGDPSGEWENIQDLDMGYY